MKRNLVSSENPIAFFTDVFPEYMREGIAIDCGHIILIQKGSASLRVNFQYVNQEKDNVTILFPGDVVMLENKSNDFELKYIVFSKYIVNDIFSQQNTIKRNSIEAVRGITSHSISSIAHAMFKIISTFMSDGKSNDSRQVTIMQLCSFYTIYQSYLIKSGYHLDEYSNRKEELFTHFFHLLSKHFHENRNVTFYANKLCITPKYLSNILASKIGKKPKLIIDEYTIMHIRLALKDTDKTINEIALIYNFSSSAFFCYYFKHQTGETPLEYRERQQHLSL